MEIPRRIRGRLERYEELVLTMELANASGRRPALPDDLPLMPVGIAVGADRHRVDLGAASGPPGDDEA